MIFWVSEHTAYIPIDVVNVTAAINYIHLN
jgi:hypothetical protein